jgi:hypothetical protein
VAVLDDHDDRACDVGLLKRVWDKPVQPSFQISLSELCGAWFCDAHHERCADDNTEHVMQATFNHSYHPTPRYFPQDDLDGC